MITDVEVAPMTTDEVLDRYVESETEKLNMQFYLEGLDAWNEEVDAPMACFNQYLEGYISGRWLAVERNN